MLTLVGTGTGSAATPADGPETSGFTALFGAADGGDWAGIRLAANASKTITAIARDSSLAYWAFIICLLDLAKKEWS
jgi:hypothetical protein